MYRRAPHIKHRLEPIRRRRSPIWSFLVRQLHRHYLVPAATSRKRLRRVGQNHNIRRARASLKHRPNLACSLSPPLSLNFRPGSPPPAFFHPAIPAPPRDPRRRRSASPRDVSSDPAPRYRVRSGIHYICGVPVRIESNRHRHLVHRDRSRNGVVFRIDHCDTNPARSASPCSPRTLHCAPDSPHHCGILPHLDLAIQAHIHHVVAPTRFRCPSSSRRHIRDNSRHIAENHASCIRPARKRQHMQRP